MDGTDTLFAKINTSENSHEASVAYVIDYTGRAHK